MFGVLRVLRGGAFGVRRAGCWLVTEAASVRQIYRMCNASRFLWFLNLTPKP